MHGAPTALNRSIIGWMRSLFLAISSFTSVPENQPPQSVTSAFLRIGSITLGSSGKRRPFSIPVKPAERDWRRHSSSETSSLSSTRSSFHQAMGDMPSLAFMLLLRWRLETLRLARVFVFPAGRIDLRAHAHLGHSDVPPVPTGGRCDQRVGVNDDHVDAAGLLHLAERSFEFADRADFP